MEDALLVRLFMNENLFKIEEIDMIIFLFDYAARKV